LNPIIKRPSSLLFRRPCLPFLSRRGPFPFRAQFHLFPIFYVFPSSSPSLLFSLSLCFPFYFLLSRFSFVDLPFFFCVFDRVDVWTVVRAMQPSRCAKAGGTDSKASKLPRGRSSSSSPEEVRRPGRYLRKTADHEKAARADRARQKLPQRAEAAFPRLNRCSIRELAMAEN
jgi:hypothetical protein